MNDIKVPPFTEAQKKIIEATNKLAEKCDNINANINKWGRKNICDVDGIDEVEMTNEEWLRTLPSDERVKEILNRGFMTEERTAEEFVEWLKEKHNEV